MRIRSLQRHGKRSEQLFAEPGGYDEATTALQKSVEAESKNAQARFDLGQLYAALGDPDKAVTHLREAVKCSPENTVFADALELAQSQSMLKSNPADAQALADISLCYYKRAAGLGQDAGTLSERDMFLALADQAAGRSLELMPTCATAKRSLGLVALERGDMQRAIDTLRSACELAPLDSAAHADLGQCYAASSQADLARQCWQKVAQIEGGKRSELSEQAACYLKSR